jgi:hypothetical protein
MASTTNCTVIMQNIVFAQPKKGGANQVENYLSERKEIPCVGEKCLRELLDQLSNRQKQERNFHTHTAFRYTWTIEYIGKHVRPDADVGTDETCKGRWDLCPKSQWRPAKAGTLSYHGTWICPNRQGF